MMDTLTVRILDLISSNIHDPFSINQLTKRIKETYGSAYYANIYEKLQELKSEGLLTVELIGRSSNINLNFQNYLLIDKLAEMELEKKIDFLANRNNLFPFLFELDELLSNRAIRAVTAINPIKNIKLNRIELLFFLKDTIDNDFETIELYKEMAKMQNKHNLKISSLIITKNYFLDLCTSDEINPLREALNKQITFYCPQAFWNEIRQVAEKAQIRTLRSETKPADISELDLTYNLNRFGYREFGIHLTQGKKFCIEYITTALLLQNDARRMDAVAVILAKNSFKSNLLAFLSQKFQTTAKLIAILKKLQDIKSKPETAKTIRILKIFNVEEYPVDEESIREKLRIYNVL
jgi:hypothetical protein